MPAKRLFFVFFVFLTASFARTIDLAGDVFGSGVDFDQMQIFIETSGMQFDATAPVTYTADSVFAGWIFNLNAPTYAVGGGPETTGKRLTVKLSDSAPNASGATVTFRVYLLHSGNIVGSYEVTIGPSGMTITPESADLGTLLASQEQAFTTAGIASPGTETFGDDSGGGAGGGNGGGTNNLQAAVVGVPEPGPTGLVLATLILLGAFRKLRPSFAPRA